MEMTFEKETVYDKKSGTKIVSLKPIEAKTAREIRKEIIKAKCQWKDLTLEKRLQEQKWVLLSEHQQEIDKVKNLLVRYNKEVLGYEQKTEGLKQKLTELIELCDTYAEDSSDFSKFDKISNEIAGLLEGL